MKYSLRMILALMFFAASMTSAAAENGELRDATGPLQVWSRDRGTWVDPDTFFAAEIERLGGPTYGKVGPYPDYAKVKEWETLIDVLPDGRSCPMVFFHKRWRRLPDVLALDERLRDHGGCADVFKQ